jgi:hypothetical protein
MVNPTSRSRSLTAWQQRDHLLLEPGGEQTIQSADAIGSFRSPALMVDESFTKVVQLPGTPFGMLPKCGGRTPDAVNVSARSGVANTSPRFAGLIV